MALSSVSAPSLAAEYITPADVPKLVSRQDLWNRCAPVSLCGVGMSTVQDTALRAFWNEDRILFEFVCHDDRIVSPGEKDGLDHFLIGDVVEIFVGENGNPSYLEVHATPAGLKTAYFFRGYRQPMEASGQAGGIMATGAPTTHGWRAVISVPRSALAINGPPSQYEILAGRYDYASVGATPLLSCFPPQEGKADFHRRASFARLQLNP
ncbi:MAG: hypothetical protein WCI38_07040 [Chthoniobacterales bacterium]